jgi:hypothetical protein
MDIKSPSAPKEIILKDYYYPSLDEIPQQLITQNSENRGDTWKVQSKFLENMTYNGLQRFFKNGMVGKNKSGQKSFLGYDTNYIFHSKELALPNAHKNLLCLEKLDQINNNWTLEAQNFTDEDKYLGSQYRIVHYLIYVNKTSTSDVYFIWIEAFNRNVIVCTLDQFAIDINRLTYEKRLIADLNQWFVKQIPQESMLDILPQNAKSFHRYVPRSKSTEKEIRTCIAQLREFPENDKKKERGLEQIGKKTHKNLANSPTENNLSGITCNPNVEPKKIKRRSSPTDYSEISASRPQVNPEDLISPYTIVTILINPGQGTFPVIDCSGLTGNFVVQLRMKPEEDHKLFLKEVEKKNKESKSHSKSMGRRGTFSHELLLREEGTAPLSPRSEAFLSQVQSSQKEGVVTVLMNEEQRNDVRIESSCSERRPNIVVKPRNDTLEEGNKTPTSPRRHKKIGHSS